jgi:hypothetical protein
MIGSSDTLELAGYCASTYCIPPTCLIKPFRIETLREMVTRMLALYW